MYGFALKMSRPFPPGILDKTLKVSVENLSKAIESNAPIFIFRDILMDANIELPVESEQADELVTTLSTLVNDTSRQSETWRRLVKLHQIQFLHSLCRPVASAVDTIAVGVKRKRQDLIEELASTSETDLLGLDWSAIFSNPYPPHLVAKIVFEDKKSHDENDTVLDSMIHKVKIVYDVKPLYGEQVYK